MAYKSKLWVYITNKKIFLFVGKTTRENEAGNGEAALPKSKELCSVVVLNILLS